MNNVTNLNNLEDSWKNNDVLFYRQLEYNLKEIASVESYPNHWHVFINLIDKFNPSDILDIGCGCGIYYELCKRHFPEIIYTGMDYSEEAIELAKKTWAEDHFFVKDYKDLTTVDIKDYDLVHVGAMFDVLPNGDEALEFILSLKPRALLIGRIKLTDRDSYYDTYTAYDTITTCGFYHNKNNFLDLCSRYGYNVYQTLDNFYLRKK
jgi:2-polyprenyl-3-methyl-5-hydroxy-6-metoxy-1,4-benzoquinol methylase